MNHDGPTGPGIVKMRNFFMAFLESKSSETRESFLGFLSSALEKKSKVTGPGLGPRIGLRSTALLYSIFVNDLKEELANRGFGVKVGEYGLLSLLLYADDIILIADSAEELREMLQVVSEFAYKWRFELSNEKSEVVIFNARKQTEDEYKGEVFKMSGEKLRIVNEYKYLGCEFQNNGTWKLMSRRYKGKACKGTADLWWAGIHHGDFSVKTSRRIWETLVKPSVTYGGEIFELSNTDLQILESEQCHAAASMLGVSTKSSQLAVRSEVGWYSLKAQYDRMKLRYWRKLVMMDSSRLAKHMYEMDREEVKNGKSSNRSWCRNIRRILLSYGFDYSVWMEETCAKISEKEWHALVDNCINEAEEGKWRYGMEELSKLRTFRKLKHEYGLEEYHLVEGHNKGKRICSGLRNGSNKLRIEVGRHSGEEVEDRKCRCCSGGEVEDECHFLNECECYTLKRAIYRVGVLDKLASIDKEFNDSSLDSEAWMRLTLGDHSVISTTLVGCDSETKKSIYNSIHELSLSFIECIDDIRDKKLESMIG